MDAWMETDGGETVRQTGREIPLHTHTHSLESYRCIRTHTCVRELPLHTHTQETERVTVEYTQAPG